MDHSLFPLLTLVLVLPLFLIFSIYMLVVKASNPESMFRALDPAALSAERQQAVSQHSQWLAGQDFHYLTAFQFGSIQVVVFQQTNAPRYFSLNFAKTLSYDLVTMFADTVSLTTGSSDAIGALPCQPGAYKQGFPGVSADAALQRHADAENYLLQKFGIQWQQLTKPYEQLVLDGIRNQMAYVRSQFLWPVRALGWHFVKRKKMANVSIQQQFP